MILFLRRNCDVFVVIVYFVSQTSKGNSSHILTLEECPELVRNGFHVSLAFDPQFVNFLSCVSIGDFLKECSFGRDDNNGYFEGVTYQCIMTWRQYFVVRISHSCCQCILHVIPRSNANLWILSHIPNHFIYKV